MSISIHISHKNPVQIFFGIPHSAYCPIDLSVHNEELQRIDISDPVVCQTYIDGVLDRHNARVAYGGYLEERKLYQNSDLFSMGKIRNLHLGVDFWCSTGTKVLVPVEGKVHSFQNNATVGDYGPTIILEHRSGGQSYHTLYGHLSEASIQDLYIGKEFKAGEVLGSLGETAINVNYAPHLHFQLILDLQGNFGDYPGVCSLGDLDFQKKNCPDPMLLLNF